MNCRSYWNVPAAPGPHAIARLARAALRGRRTLQSTPGPKPHELSLTVYGREEASRDYVVVPRPRLENDPLRSAPKGPGCPAGLTARSGKRPRSGYI